MTFSFFILNFLNALFEIYAASKMLECKINFKDKKIYIVLIILSLYTFLSYIITRSVLRIVILFQIYNICNIYLYHSEKNDVQKISFVSLFGCIILLFCEIMVALGLNVFLKLIINVENINNYTYNSNLVGYVIIFLFLIITNIKPFVRILIKIINLPYLFKSYNILFCIIYVFMILTMSLYLIYFNLSQPLKLVLLIFSFFEYIYLVYFIVLTYKNKEKIKRNLELMLEVTSRYETVLNDIRTKNHENKNQLIIVKDLIKSNNKKAISYIDSMLETKYNDDDQLILKVSNIPAGGLKGLLYYKLITMKAKEIECCIEVSKEIDKNCLANLNVELLQSFYKIIGVFLDNSIEAVENCNKKIVLVELFEEDNYLIFSISNEYKEKINLDILGKKRFTTKGKDHGYGLQLVKDLISEHNELFNQTEIVGNLFIQKVGIKIKG